MIEKHWETDRAETPDQALEMLRFGVVFLDILSDTVDVDRVRTERRMISAADVLERELERRAHHIASLQAHIEQLKEESRIASWSASPDRMGGQFTQDEINGRETW